MGRDLKREELCLERLVNDAPFEVTFRVFWHHCVAPPLVLQLNFDQNR